MRTDNKALLKVESLSARIGRQVVLDNLSFEVNQGECVAVVGGSGAGKSTLLRCLMGLTRPARPYRGSLWFGGAERCFASKKQHAKPEGIAFVPQNPDHGFDPLKRLNWQWRQAARIVTGSPGFSASQQDLLDSLGLRSLGSNFPHQWSRGMQQRLLLGIALLGEPRLLILDEPTSALDSLIAAQVLRTVMTYAHEQDVALLIVTHDLALAARFATRSAIMTAGRIVEFGETSKLLDEPNTAYGKLLVSHRNWKVAVSHGDTISAAAE
ncbi:ATP-binding cassette domain-containing protein [Labrenzia sp. DG1229]|uniref:ABC transporter ATP-binding protein n=1 Tax=Labrenzia sp. DG1229 TaxID=681847 RepID=UPI001AD8F53F|nr:ATP-binding cassette domain-containing protein [Labrenzia sp. DG1229]